MTNEKRRKPVSRDEGASESDPIELGRLLTPAEKARQLGVSPDTLRRWENEGRIQAELTAGKQRRYRERDRPRLADFDDDQYATPQEREPAPSPSSAPAVAPWDARIHEKRADVEIARLNREHEAIIRAQRDEREARQRQREEAERRAVVEREQEAARQREEQRLARLRDQGALIAAVAPLEHQARVKRELLAHVTTENFPAQLNPFEAHALLTKRVEAILKPWRDETRVQELLREMRTHAQLRTFRDWDDGPAQDARREVEQRLRTEIDASWTKDDVHARVDEILAQWEE
jgi:excisionase family DNA binding protein